LYFSRSMRVFWFSLLISLCGVASAQLLDDVANSALETSKIRAIRFEGLQSGDESTVRSRVHLDSNQALTPATLASKVKSSVTSLYESGLFDDVSVFYEYSTEHVGELSVVFRLKELPTLDTFEIEGNDAVTSEDLHPKITLVPGRIYNKSVLERSRQAILEYYRKEGYLLAEVGITETPKDENKNLVTFNISEGEKVVINSFDIKGNKDVPTDDITEGIGLETTSWYGGGEFKQESFDAGRDSVLLVCKAKGFLDAALTNYTAEYLPDSTFKFYLGRMVKPTATTDALFQQLNRDIGTDTNPMHELAGLTIEKSSGYYRTFRKNFSAQGQAIPVPVIKTEEQAAEILNHLITYADLRKKWIATLPTKAWAHSDIDSLLKIAKRNDFEDRRLARLTLEETYPALQVWDSVKTSSLVNVNISINEGRRYYAGSVRFFGNQVLSEPYLQSMVQLDSGKIFDYRKYEMSKKGAMDLYREDGYLFSRLDEKREYQDSIVNLSFTVTEGLPAMIRRVNIKGNTRTKDKVIRREIKLFPGDTYRQSLMERSFRDIYQLNYFDNLTPDIQPVEGSDQDVDLVFNVAEKEAGTGTFSAGLAYSQRDGLTGTMGVQIPNCCMGDGNNASVSLEYGTAKRNIAVGFANPWLMDKPIKLGGSANYTWTQASTSADRNVLQWGFGSYLGKRLTWPDDYFYGQVDLDFQRYDQGANVVGSMIRYSGFQTSAGVSIIRDDKNLPTFPTEGSRFTASISKAGVLDFDFVRTELGLKWWFPVFDVNHQTLALGINNEYGMMSGSSIQYSSLYQMGGALGYRGLMRGYAAGSIGYRRLGRSYQFISAEFTFPVAENRFYLLPLFFDAGNVFGKRYDPSIRVSSNQASPMSEWDPASLKRDVGFGFRVIVPMLGIIGFDFAWPLDPGETYSGFNETTIGGMQFNFLIGQGF